MKIEYSIEKEDYIDFNMDQFKNSKDLKKIFILQKGVISSTFLVFILYLYKYTERPLYQFLLVYGVILIGWIIFESLIIGFLVKKKLELESKQNVELFGEKSLDIKDEGLYDLSGEEILKIEWSDVKFIDESKDYLFIFVVTSLGYIIPKRYLTDETIKDKFIEKVKKNIE